MSIIRDAGYNERRCIARDVLGLYGSIVTVARYDLETASDSTAWQRQLSSALQQCVQKHAALSVVVKNSTTEKPVLAKLDSIDVATHLTLLDAIETTDETETITELLRSAHARPLSDYESRPQWQVYAMPAKNTSTTSIYIAFATSHVVMDGKSCTILHSSLLQALNGISTSHLDTMLAPALDKAATFPISWSFLLKPLLEEKLPGPIARLFGLKKEQDIWYGTSKRPTLDRISGHVPMSLKVLLVKADTLERVLTTCRAHEAKLTALLTFVTAKSLSEALHKRGQNEDIFATSIPFDLRRAIPGGVDRMANYVSVVEQIVEVRTTAPQLTAHDWEQIRQITTLLQERSSTLDDQPIALLRYLSNFREWVSKKASEQPQESFAVSNLGSFTARGDVQPWRISQMVFSQSADVTSGPLNVNVASSDDGPLSIVLTWLPEMLGIAGDENVFVNEVCEALARRLDSITMPGR